ncbi:MAG: FecR domain-containing protein [Gammaproteobacteria bacterium]|nr:FecR domain-containing protein [Gammaproteobacteria bacterium]
MTPELISDDDRFQLQAHEDKNIGPGLALGERHMKTLHRLLPSFALLTFLTAFAPTVVYAAAPGKIVFAIGEVQVQDARQVARGVGKGDPVFAGETVVTKEGRVQMQFADGGFISLQSNSTLRIDEYRYEGVVDGMERGFFSLLKGGIRAVTGLIGGINRETYKVQSVVATIGIRGTGFFALLCQGDCVSANGTPIADGLYVQTGEGTIYVANTIDSLDVPARFAVYVKDANTAPVYITKLPQPAFWPEVIPPELIAGEAPDAQTVAAWSVFLGRPIPPEVGPLAGLTPKIKEALETGLQYQQPEFTFVAGDQRDALGNQSILDLSPTAPPPPPSTTPPPVP